MAFKDKSLKAYTGDEPYLFMSYSHRDSDAVEPILRALQAKYHVWYDEGIIPASKWAKEIARHVRECDRLLALISRNYLESNNCLDELEFARSLEHSRLLVFLEDIKLPDELALRHNRYQHIRKSRYNSAEELLGIIERAEGIERCLATETPNEATMPSPVEDFEYDASDDGVTITGYKGKGGAVVIPSKIDGKPVTRIGVEAFSGCTGLTSVTIPDSVTRIGDRAFVNCTSLPSVTIPNRVTSIGNWAFDGCTGLTSVTIPDSVAYIRGGAFANCASLRSIVVSKKNPAFIDIDGVLYNRERTALLAFPKGKETAAFIIPDRVTSIGWGAFADCTSLTSVTIPDSVTSIGNAAFYGCTGLSSITIPDSVISIGVGAFSGCTGLTSVTIPDSVTSIGVGAFSGCTGLTSVTIPDSVTSIGDGAFRGCEQLKDVYYAGSESQLRAIEIGDNNAPLTAATIHYNTPKPTASP